MLYNAVVVIVTSMCMSIHPYTTGCTTDGAITQLLFLLAI